MLHSLLTGTIDNLSSQTPVEALTGPFARKDMAAIGHHAERIHTHAPHALETYQSLAELTARMMSWSESEQVQLNMLFNHLSEGH